MVEEIKELPPSGEIELWKLHSDYDSMISWTNILNGAILKVKKQVIDKWRVIASVCDKNGFVEKELEVFVAPSRDKGIEFAQYWMDEHIDGVW